ncbi:MAG: hypothetical protein EPO63_05770 [Candidatus Nitrosotenuis sp.]|nr:MAG: hypothetical protein EPO63_05770 [Candidatus Nitrosotenuis sp.]
MDYKNLYNNIMNLDSKIRFVTIVDTDGRLMFGGQREGLSNYLTPTEERESIRHAIEAWKLRMKFTGSIGAGKYAMAEYEKIKRITIPLDDKHIIYMTTEVEADHSTIINKILQMTLKNMIR